jgi:hypothetical protein
MDTTKLILGTIAGTITSFIVGFLLFGFALAGFMAENVAGKEPMDMVMLIVGHVFLALLITYIFLKWAGIKTIGGGATGGFIIGLLAALGFNFIWYATTTLFPGGLTAVLVDAFGTAIVAAAAGAGAGWVLGRGKE